MNGKTIAFISTTASSFYGFRRDLIRQLVKEGYIIYAFTSEYSDLCLKRIRELGAEPIPYSMSRGGVNPFSDILACFQLINLLKQIKPDIVFSYFTKPVVYGTLAAKFSRVPKVFGMIEGLGTPFTIHRNRQNFKIKFIRFMQINLYRLVFRFLDKIIFLNRDDPIDLIKKNNISHKKNAINILGPIGLNLNEYPYATWSEKKPISFIFIARLLAEKGIYEYIEAAKIVKAKYPTVIFKIIGGLDMQNPYGLSEQQLNDLIKLEIIEYAGYVNNVAQFIVDTAVFVLPSYYREGIPRSTQEAMAIGRPVITTDVPGCRETVVDGVNGFLVPKWDSEALAEKMCYFIENPEMINVMGLESYKIAQQNFDVFKVNKKLFEIMGLDNTNETTC